MRKSPNIAVLGADDPLGAALLDQISERDAEIGEVFPLSLAESDGCATVRGEELPLLDAEGFDWSLADVLVNAVHGPAVSRIEAAATATGCRVVGLGRDGALPDILHRVLAPIQALVPLAEVTAVATLPVALAGEAGVAELAAQTRALFAMETVEPEVFPLRIAFNVIPQVGRVAEDGVCAFERDAADGLRRLLGRPDLAVAVTALWAPLFYGAGVAVHIRAAGVLDLADIRARLHSCPGVTLMDSVLPGGVATPATDAQDSDAVFVSRLRAGGSEQALDMWLVADAIRLEAMRLADRLENLIEK